MFSPLRYRGQTLVELMVAISVIIIGLTAAASMIFSNVRIQEISSDRVVAANLAREGIEFAKSVRDSNWLSGSPFYTGLQNGTDYTGVPVVNTSGVFTGFNFTAATIDTDSWTVIKTSTAAPSSGALMGQGTAFTGTATIFKRLVTLQPICSDDTVLAEGATCSAPFYIVGIRVTSQAVWDRRGERRQSVVVDEIYDWR
jgi:Tfp pilus assembly protein PilV